MLPDSTNPVVPGSRGRDSIRISSKRSFDESVTILDLEHMPHGCGTWPAFWSFSATGPWPTGGEIDVIEVTTPSHAKSTILKFFIAGRSRVRPESHVIAYPS